MNETSPTDPTPRIGVIVDATASMAGGEGDAAPLQRVRSHLRTLAADQPDPHAVPTVSQPIDGDLRLVVDGLPEDRGWEPYVAIAQGTAKRRRGRRARTTRETRLLTHERSFELAPLTEEQTLVFHRMLPELPLLGGAVPEQGPFAEPPTEIVDPTTVDLRTDDLDAFGVPR